MIKKIIPFLLFSGLSFGNIILPTFKLDNTKSWNHYGEQIYHAADSHGIMWQLKFWSNNQLPLTGLNQALQAVLSNAGKDSGTVSGLGKTSQLLHASAGFDDQSASLLYIIDGSNYRVVGIQRHIPVKKCQEPKYELIAWDSRFIRD